MVCEGCPGHGPIHLLSASAAEIVFRWDPGILAWVRPGLPPLSNLAGPIQHFMAAILDAWHDKFSVDLCGRKGFRGGPLLDVHGSLQLLNSSHVRERDKALLRSIMVGGVWNGFLLGRVRSQIVPCRFCGAPDGVLLRFVKILNFMISSEWIRDIGLGVCFGMVGFQSSLVLMVPPLGLLVLVIVPVTLLNLRLAVTLVGWGPPVGFDAVEAASLLPASPNVWTDGSLVLDRVTGVSSSGAGFFDHHPVLLGSSVLGSC